MKDSLIKSDNDSINVQYTIQTVQVKLRKIRRNSLLKPDQSKGCYTKTETTQENNNSYVYIHCSVLN